MSEQVQVREGVWLTREGEEIEVRARDVTGIDTEWRWEGKRRGHYNTWRDDGTIHIEREQKEGDLVTYLRPLPEPDPEPEPAPKPTPAPQPVKLCAGIWKTRSGHEVEVRENIGQLTPDFPWRGAFFGVMEIWRNNGRWMNDMHYDHRDLVEYVGPLQQQTTTDTLAEIEANMAEAEKDVAELVQQDETCRLQAELVLVTAERETLRADLTEVASERDALVREINEATAERDRLEQQLATMTTERDLLAQRLVTKPSEESLQKQNAKQQIEINTLKDRLQDMTTDRDRLAKASANPQRLAADLRGEVDFVRTQKTAQEHELRAEIGRLQRELQQARIEIDAAGQQPAPADTSEQIERIWDEARERAVSEIIELVIPLQVATGTHAESVLQILPAVIRRWMDGGTDDVE
jgi:predicted  nucleic acid-binding Zn-ribbon protein